MEYLMTVLGIFLLDYKIKARADSQDFPDKTPKVVQGKLSFRRVRNEAGSFGSFQSHPKWAHMLSFVSWGGAFAVFLMHLIKGGSSMAKAGLSLLLGGGLGNCWERMTKGYVCDYVSLKTGKKKIDDIVFNFADICIAAGSVLYAASQMMEHLGKKAKGNHAYE